MGNIVGLILNTGWVARSVLILLGVLSIVSWAVILEKLILFRRIRGQSKAFDALVRKNPGNADLYRLSRDYPHCAPAVFYMRAYREYHAFRQKRQAAGLDRAAVSVAAPDLALLVRSTLSETLEQPSRNLTLLSTIVGISPFLGLFGTVWGVMESFIQIGLQGTADLSAVGPGIAEALITTAAGLAVAIPALAAHNWAAAELRKIEDRLDLFSDESRKRFDGESAA
ncbi:MAG: MotA/TolQ/ExbB proton channel family protein [bacterium]|nr:MotA/TolQ/ExbB proton channel family protein [bacterium]